MLFSGKIPFRVAARLTARFWVQHLLRFVTIRDCSPLFALFETIRSIRTIRYSGLFAVRYSRLFAIRYSSFPDTLDRFPELPESNYNIKTNLVIEWSPSSCVIRTAFSREKWQIASPSYQKVIRIWKQTWWSNDKTIIELGHRKILWFVNVSQINYLPAALGFSK